MKRISLFTLGSIALLSAAGAFAASDAEHPKQMHWPFDGYFGMVDKQAAQRGFQVYKEVCASCHSLKRIAFRQLKDTGFTDAEVQALAASYTITDGPNDSGDMFERSGRPSDKIPAPFANDNAARAANGGLLPPDLSLIIKARHDGANYVHSLLTGYQEAGTEPLEAIHNIEAKDSKEVTPEQQIPPVSTKNNLEAIKSGSETTPSKQVAPVGPPLYDNPYFPGGKIGMAPPLSEGIVSYEDNTEASVDQMARDVVIFLQWAAEPEMEHRKAMGMKILVFLLIMTGFLYAAKRRIWSHIKH